MLSKVGLPAGVVALCCFSVLQSVFNFLFSSGFQVFDFVIHWSFLCCWSLLHLQCTLQIHLKIDDVEIQQVDCSK